MSESRSPAVCQDCGKSYRVPDASRTYRCKACGGTVSAVESETPNRRAAAPAAAVEARRREPRSAESKERRRAASALQRSYRWIRAVAWLYRVSAVVWGLAAIGRMATLPSDAIDPLVLTVELAFLSVMVAVFVVGSIQVRFQPFAWSLGIALLATLNAAGVWANARESPLAPIVASAWAVLVWAAVPATARFRRLVREHGDLYIVHRIHGTHRRRRDSRSSDEELLAAARSRALRTSAVAAVLVLALSGAGGWTVYAQRPDTLEFVLEDLAAAWDRGDVEALGAWLPPDERVETERYVAAVADAHGWGAAWPRVAEVEWRLETTGRGAAELVLEDGGVVRTVWRLQGSAWEIADLTLPLPPMDDIVVRFTHAWNRSDLDGITTFFRLGSRDKMKRGIESSAARRGWADTLPPILETTAVQRGDGRTELSHQLDDGVLVTRWQFEDDGAFRLTGLRFPGE
jgi:hypothetical protein